MPEGPVAQPGCLGRCPRSCPPPRDRSAQEPLPAPAFAGCSLRGAGLRSPEGRLSGELGQAGAGIGESRRPNAWRGYCPSAKALHKRLRGSLFENSAIRGVTVCKLHRNKTVKNAEAQATFSVTELLKAVAGPTAEAMWPLSHLGARREAGLPPALPDSGSAERRPSRAQPSPLRCPHRRSPPGPARRPLNLGPRTRQSRVPGAPPAPAAASALDPRTRRGRVTVGQGQSAAGPGRAEERAAAPRPGSPSAPQAGQEGGGRSRSSRAAQARGPTGPGPAPRTPAVREPSCVGLLRLSVSGPRNPQARAPRRPRLPPGLRVRAPRYPASPPLDLDPRPHRGPTRTSGLTNGRLAGTACQPAAAAAADPPPGPPDGLLWGPTKAPGSHN